MSSMKPCPFCGSEDVQVVAASVWYGEERIFSVRCGRCGASGPPVMFRAEEQVRGMRLAAHQWNTRQDPRRD